MYTNTQWRIGIEMLTELSSAVVCMLRVLSTLPNKKMLLMTAVARSR